MRFLVSGANGFIGGALVDAMKARGDTVHRLGRRSASPGDAELLVGERRIDAARLPGASLEGLDGAIHLIGEPITPLRWTPAKRERIRSSRVATTDILARELARLETPPPVLISGSAIGYYGDGGERILDEGSPAGSNFLAELCLAWEAATGPARDRGIRVVQARTGIVIGPDGGALAKQLPLFRAGLGGRLGSGRQWTSFISLADEVQALLYLLGEDSLSGPFNLTSPQPIRNAELTKAIGSVVSRPTLLPVPRTVLRLAMGRLVADEVILASQRVVPKRLVEGGFTFTEPDIEMALAGALGRSPKTRSARTRR